MGHVFFVLAMLLWDNIPLLITHARGFELGVFNPDADRVTADDLGIELALFDAR